MTNQPANNEWIEKAFEQYKLKSDCRCYYNEFEYAILTNLPKSISREEVDKLREKRQNHTNRDVESRWHNIEEIIRDLDQLLSPKE